MDLAALAAIAGGANADAVACAAREADWRALRWTAEKLVLHAAQNPKVTANAYALAATQKAATRLQKIAANAPDPEGDDEGAVSATMCSTLADVGATADGLSPAHVDPCLGLLSFVLSSSSKLLSRHQPPHVIR